MGKLRVKRELIKKEGEGGSIKTIMNRSIIILYYLRKKKKYKDFF